MALTWPNEPVGSALVSDWNMNGIQSPWAQYWHDYTSPSHFTTDGTAPSGDGHILYNYHAGSPPAQDGVLGIISGMGQRRCYFGVALKQSNPFGGYPNSTNKVIWIILGDSPRTWICIDAHGPQHSASWPFMVFIEQNESLIDNTHLPYRDDASPPYGTVRLRGANMQYFPVGQWHQVEFFVLGSTGYATKDGRLMWWVNGALIGDYTELNTTYPYVTEVQITHTWDGETVNPYAFAWSFDHARVSMPSVDPGSAVSSGTFTTFSVS